MSPGTRTPTVLRVQSRALPVVLALATVAWAACGSDPFAIKWSISPDTVTLYSLARSELGLPSGFNFYNRVPVLVEGANSTGNWDMAVGTEDGAIVLLPPGALNVPGKARVAALPGMTFDEVVEAPADTTLYSAVQPVLVQMGTVYVIRTNQTVGSFGTYCVHYAKLAPLEIDAAQGTLRFVFDSSPVCNDRALVPKN